MARILAAHVDNDTRAANLRQELLRLGVAAGDMQKFYTPPAGQHATFPIGGDVHTDEGARAAPRNARMGIAIGAALGALLGLVAGGLGAEYAPLAGRATLPLAIALAAGIGALLGGLFGTMRGLSGSGQAVTGQDALETGERALPEANDRRKAVPVRRGGLMLAVCLRSLAREREIVAALRRGGGQDIEWADGRWEDGGWSDFDPVSAPRLVDEPVTAAAPHLSTASPGTQR